MIKDFLINGNVEGLSLGKSKAEVRSFLGEAKTRSESNGGMEIWKYSDVEVAFDGDIVSFIGFYFDNGTIILPFTFFPGRVMKIEESQLADFKGFLLANNIDFVVDESLTFDEQTCLRVLQSRVGIYFIQDELHSVQLSKDAIL